MFDEFVDNTERYEEFIEELLEANREGRFDDVFNRAYGMGTFSIDELIDIYARVDNDCVTNYRSKNESEEAVELEALRLAILQSLSEANTSAIAFELAACFFDHFSKEAEGMDMSDEIAKCLTKIFKCIASTGSWSEFLPEQSLCSTSTIPVFPTALVLTAQDLPGSPAIWNAEKRS